ncbi:MAG: hypothetical protein KME20_10975 [Kaiparowitsia implicata GSE-PSE-MK54-09C]|nr:hypothetical protein [Kaiparowitsia implicata GSE-PSE-MK54-09C]
MIGDFAPQVGAALPWNDAGLPFGSLTPDQKLSKLGAVLNSELEEAIALLPSSLPDSAPHPFSRLTGSDIRAIASTLNQYSLEQAEQEPRVGDLAPGDELNQASGRQLKKLALSKFILDLANKSTSYDPSETAADPGSFDNLLNSTLDPTDMGQTSDFQNGEETLNSSSDSDIESAPLSETLIESMGADVADAQDAAVQSTSGLDPNPLQVLIDDATLPHDAKPAGVPDYYDWAQGPVTHYGSTPPSNFTAMTAWGQLYEAEGGNSATNTRVQLDGIQTYVLSKATGQWTLLQDAAIEGAAFQTDYANNTNKPAGLRDEGNGSISVMAGDGYTFHFWPKAVRATINPTDIAGVFTKVDARLILDDPSQADDRHTAEYVLNMGGDYWLSPEAQWDNFKSSGGIAMGRFKKVSADWQSFTMTTLTAEQLQDNPPPLASVLSPGVFDDSSTEVSADPIDEISEESDSGAIAPPIPNNADYDTSADDFTDIESVSSPTASIFEPDEPALPALADATAPSDWLQAIIDDSTLPHEARAAGVPDYYDWAKAPRMGSGNNPPDNFTAITAWGQLYEAAAGNPATNSRVQLDDLKTYVLSKATGQWTLLQDAAIEGAAFQADYVNNGNKPAGARDEGEGSISVIADNGYNFHFWPKAARATIDPNDIAGVYTTVQGRLVVDDSAKPDDRASAQYVLGMGADYWLSPEAGWDNFNTNVDVAIGRFKLVTPKWQSFNMTTLSAEQLLDNPPPMG